MSEVHRFVPVLTIITDMGHHFQRGDHIYFEISSSLNALVFLDLRKVNHLLYLVPRPFRGEVLLRLAPHIRGGQWQSLVPIVVKIVLSNVIWIILDLQLGSVVNPRGRRGLIYLVQSLYLRQVVHLSMENLSVFLSRYLLLLTEYLCLFITFVFIVEWTLLGAVKFFYYVIVSHKVRVVVVALVLIV